MIQRLVSVCMGVVMTVVSVPVFAEEKVPMIDSLSFDSLVGPGYFEIHGKNFSTTPEVFLNGTALNIFTALPHKIVVANTSSSNANLLVKVGEEEATFLYKTPNPKIYRISSEAGIVPNAELTLHGEYFSDSGSAQVLLDGIALPVLSSSDSEITVRLPRDLQSSNLLVRVGKLDSQSVSLVPSHTMTFLSKGVRFFNSPSEVISVRVAGLGSDLDALSVYFDDEPLKIINFAGDSLEVQLPARIRSGSLYVMRDGQKSNFLPIIYQKAPTITAIGSLEDKTIKATHPQTTFVVSGNNFGTEKAKVSLNDDTYDFTTWSDSSINVRARVAVDEFLQLNSLYMTRGDGVSSNTIPVLQTFTGSLDSEKSRVSFVFDSQLHNDANLDSSAVMVGEDVVLGRFSLANQNQPLYIQRFSIDMILDNLEEAIALHQFGDVRLRSSYGEYPLLLDGVGNTISMKVLESVFVTSGDKLEIVADVYPHTPQDLSYQLKANLSSRQLFGFTDYKFGTYANVDRDMVLSQVYSFESKDDAYCQSFISGDYDCNGIDDQQELANEQEQQLLAEVVELQEEFVAALEELQEEEEIFKEEVAAYEDDIEKREELGYGTSVMTTGHSRQLVLPRLASSDLDSDNDGLFDSVEYVIGTDPNKEDSDGDTISDGDELQRGWDPKSTKPYVFTDQKKLAWAEPYVMEMHFNGLITGDAMDQVRPAANISRAELLKILTQAFSLDHLSAEDGIAFTDTENHWVNQYALFAFENNLVRGYRDGTFWPDREVSRAEALKLLFKFMEIDIDQNATTHFVDVTGWQVPYVALAEDLELVRSSSRFNPNQALKRGEAFKIIASALRKL